MCVIPTVPLNILCRLSWLLCTLTPRTAHGETSDTCIPVEINHQPITPPLRLGVRGGEGEAMSLRACLFACLPACTRSRNHLFASASFALSLPEPISFLLSPHPPPPPPLPPPPPPYALRIRSPFLFHDAQTRSSRGPGGALRFQSSS